MSERVTDALITVVVVVIMTAWVSYDRTNVGRCQSACWFSGYTYTSTDAAACLCDNAGVPVAVAVPEAPHGR